jgi:hypothetical protein
MVTYAEYHRRDCKDGKAKGEPAGDRRRETSNKPEDLVCV